MTRLCQESSPCVAAGREGIISVAVEIWWLPTETPCRQEEGREAAILAPPSRALASLLWEIC